MIKNKTIHTEGECKLTEKNKYPNEALSGEKSTDLSFFNDERLPVTKDTLRQAELIRKSYQREKRCLEDRIVAEEKAWRRKLYLNENDKENQGHSSYMWSAVVNKHADMMDNYPEPVFLPREESDREQARVLSSIVPVILERNDFEQVYSDSEWYRIKHGTSCIGVFWDTGAENGRGDIAIKNIDLLNVFYKGGIKDIQDSPNLFICAAVPRSSVKEEFPFADIPQGSEAQSLTSYESKESLDRSDQVLLVDWYYKRRVGGKNVLHLCKYCGDELLYASENDPELRTKGFYDHGLYPITLNTLYPEEDSCTGYGVIAATENAQRYIDELDELLLSYAKTALKPRWFAKKSAGVNVKQYLDSNEAIVDVEGDIDSERLRQITVTPISPIYFNILERKITELKETVGNRDVNSGGTGSGVTSGAAIATLQEAGNKTSRDAVKTDYRAFVKVIKLVLELIRQFYSDERVFRITSPEAGESFIRYTNRELLPKEENGVTKTSVFDICVKAQKNNPFSRLSQNETAAELYKMGAFNPEYARQALIMLSMMDFEGKDEIKTLIEESAKGEGLPNTGGNRESALKKSYPEELAARANASYREGIL